MEKIETVLRVARMLLIPASVYLYFFRHETVWAGVCFLVIGILDMVTKSLFTILFLVGVLLILSPLDNKVPLLIVSVLVVIIALVELIHFIKILPAMREIWHDKTKYRHFLWENDISVRIWKRLTGRKNLDTN